MQTRKDFAEVGATDLGVGKEPNCIRPPNVVEISG